MNGSSWTGMSQEPGTCSATYVTTLHSRQVTYTKTMSPCQRMWNPHHSLVGQYYFEPCPDVLEHCYTKFVVHKQVLWQAPSISVSNCTMSPVIMTFETNFNRSRPNYEICQVGTIYTQTCYISLNSCVLTRVLRTGWSGVRVPADTGNFSLHHYDQIDSGSRPASYKMGTRGCFPGGKAAGVVKMTTHLHLVLRSGMRGVIPSLPQYASMVWCSFKGKAQEQLYFYLDCP